MPVHAMPARDRAIHERVELLFRLLIDGQARKDLARELDLLDRQRLSFALDDHRGQSSGGQQRHHTTPSNTTFHRSSMSLVLAPRSACRIP
jgi:hypothetical protein